MTLCTVFADTTAIKKDRKQRGSSAFYTLDFRVVLQCGLTELKAQISWIEQVSAPLFPTSVDVDDGAMLYRA